MIVSLFIIVYYMKLKDNLTDYLTKEINRDQINELMRIGLKFSTKEHS